MKLFYEQIKWWWWWWWPKGFSRGLFWERNHCTIQIRKVKNYCRGRYEIFGGGRGG